MVPCICCHFRFHSSGVFFQTVVFFRSHTSRVFFQTIQRNHFLSHASCVFFSQFSTSSISHITRLFLTFFLFDLTPVGVFFNLFIIFDLKHHVSFLSFSTFIKFDLTPHVSFVKILPFPISKGHTSFFRYFYHRSQTSGFFLNSYHFRSQTSRVFSFLFNFYQVRSHTSRVFCQNITISDLKGSHVVF